MELNIEDYVFIILIIAIIINIYGNDCKRKGLKIKAHNLYMLALFITLIIYVYFLYNNYKLFKESNALNKKNSFIKLFGSIFLLVGLCCLIYFENNDKSLIDAPEL